MTEKTSELDIVQRVAKALQCSSEPRLTSCAKFDSAVDTVIGEVPEHLRHLHNLVEELSKEALNAELRFEEAAERFDAVRIIFLDALAQHVPSNGFARVMLCENWQVVGFKHDDDEPEIVLQQNEKDEG